MVEQKRKNVFPNDKKHIKIIQFNNINLLEFRVIKILIIIYRGTGKFTK